MRGGLLLFVIPEFLIGDPDGAVRSGQANTNPPIDSRSRDRLPAEGTAGMTKKCRSQGFIFFLNPLDFYLNTFHILFIIIFIRSVLIHARGMYVLP